MTRPGCATLESSGLWQQWHLELVGGELISKLGKKRPHVNTLVAVEAWLNHWGTVCESRSAN
jgi:hypothetical protein